MEHFFTRIASRSAFVMGQPGAFVGAASACVIWAVSGPMFNYSDTWQLVINTATTVLTFLAVFLIQNSQNRDGAAIQAKLDEILRAIGAARVGFVGIEDMTDREIADLKRALEREVLEEAEGGSDPPQSEVTSLLEKAPATRAAASTSDSKRATATD